MVSVNNYSIVGLLIRQDPTNPHGRTVFWVNATSVTQILGVLCPIHGISASYTFLKFLKMNFNSIFCIWQHKKKPIQCPSRWIISNVWKYLVPLQPIGQTWSHHSAHTTKGEQWDWGVFQKVWLGVSLRSPLIQNTHAKRGFSPILVQI